MKQVAGGHSRFPYQTAVKRQNAVQEGLGFSLFAAD